jgi:hypothetical protein
MNNLTKKLLLGTSLAASWLLTNSAHAGPIPYATPGLENPATYTFTAVATGHVIGYFAGSGASYDEVVGMSVNGGSPGAFGLDNHTTAIGGSFDFGAVTAGDILKFYVHVNSTGYTYSSDKTQNVDGKNHLYSTQATAGQAFAGSPVGTYIAFEDLLGGGDFNYHDNTFVFTNVANGVDNVPDGGATVALLGAGLTGLVALRRRFRRA